MRGTLYAIGQEMKPHSIKMVMNVLITTLRLLIVQLEELRHFYTETLGLSLIDFHPGNIILSSRGPIIIDWMNALVGNQAADVTRSSMMFQSHALPPKVAEPPGPNGP